MLSGRKFLEFSTRAAGVCLVSSLPVAHLIRSDSSESWRSTTHNSGSLEKTKCSDGGQPVSSATPVSHLSSSIQSPLNAARTRTGRRKTIKEADKDQQIKDQILCAKDCFPNFSRHGKDSLLRKYLTPQIFERLHGKSTELGVQLDDIIRAGTSLPYGARPPRGIAGVYCGDAECYTVFGELLDPLIREYHRAASRVRLQRHRTNLDYKSLLQRKIDPKGEYILFTRMRLARSIDGFRFSPCMNRGERRKIEKLLKECSGDWGNEGGYMSVMDMTNRQHDDLVHRRVLFPDPDEFAVSAGLGRDWPDGRGIYCDTWERSPNIMIWCNAWDHFWIISDAKGGDVQGVFTKLSKQMWALETSLKQRGYGFVEHPRLGFLNASPRDIGTALRASVYVKLVRLGRRPEFDEILRKLRLEAHGTESSRYSGIFDIANAEALGKSEVELINIMISGVGTLIELEKKLEDGQEIDLHMV